MHVYCADLVVVIGCIIVNPFGSVEAGRVNRDLILSLRHLAAASLLINRTQNVEKLADAFLFRIPGNGIAFHKRHARKSRLRREISRKPHRTHTPAVACKRNLTGKSVLRLLRR